MATGNVSVFMAFGTLGDVLPLAYVALAFGRAATKHTVIFVTHASHQSLKALLDPAGLIVKFVSAPAALPPEEKRTSFPDSLSSAIHMDECLSVIETQQSHGTIHFIAINFFAMEGWHIAELLNVQCIVLAPYVIPYSAPSSFERNFKRMHPLLYRRLRQASPEEVGWKDIAHWMWTLFMDRWTSWRVEKLHLSACPLTDPVTGLPIHNWPRAVPLLYGFSREIVECPDYWPRSVHVCGFWMPPDIDSKTLPPKLSEFLMVINSSKPVFIGLSSISSMGFLHNPEGMLQVVREVLKALNKRGILFTAGHKSLDAAVLKVAGSGYSSLENGLVLDNSLFCYSGYVPYKCLLPECSVVIHHGGSGTTAACLSAGVPQVICPFILDQFYWAERMAWIGVSSQPLKPFHLVPSANETDIAGAVRAVAASLIEASKSEIKNRAMEVVRSISHEDGCSKAVEIIMKEMRI